MSFTLLRPKITRSGEESQDSYISFVRPQKESQHHVAPPKVVAPGWSGEGIFIDSKASFKGFFAHHIGIQSALFFVFSEIMVAILAM